MIFISRYSSSIRNHQSCYYCCSQCVTLRVPPHYLVDITLKKKFFFKDFFWRKIAQKSGILAAKRAIVQLDQQEIKFYPILIFYSPWQLHQELRYETLHQKAGYGGQVNFMHTLPMYPTILETLGPKELIYANFNQIWNSYDSPGPP